jgi:hypothetical protein
MAEAEFLEGAASSAAALDVELPVAKPTEYAVRELAVAVSIAAVCSPLATSALCCAPQ